MEALRECRQFFSIDEDHVVPDGVAFDLLANLLDGILRNEYGCECFRAGLLSFQRPSMKIKVWQLEYEFDKEDARIVVPLVLLLLGLLFTRLNKEVLWAGALAYYLLYFFLASFVARMRLWLFFRCPYCKSREVILQGYQGYHSDENYAYHLCNRCRKTSVFVNERLIKATHD